MYDIETEGGKIIVSYDDVSRKYHEFGWGRKTKTNGGSDKTYVHHLRSNVSIPPDRHVSHEQENTQRE
jgi:hypothetical protein